MLIKQGGAGGGVDAGNRPNITFDGKWSGWYVDFYGGDPYWEAMFATSGTLVAAGSYEADAWGIGGGGAGGCYYRSGSKTGTGGGSGYTNAAYGLTLSGSVPVTIGAGGSTLSYAASSSYKGGNGGSTTLLSLSCGGGNGGSGTSSAGGAGGSNGAGYGNGGSNGTPGDGKIMSKFWSTEHATDYGAGGVEDGCDNAGGGGGFREIGGPNSTSGHGYGGGGGGFSTSGAYTAGRYDLDWRGKSGCLILRIKA